MAALSQWVRSGYEPGVYRPHRAAPLPCGQRFRSRPGPSLALPLVLSLLSCSRLNLPQGPELAELDAAYDDPAGIVDGEQLAELAPLVALHLDTILSLGRLDFVTESLKEVSDALGNSFVDEAGTHFRVSAVASVERACPGLEAMDSVGGAGGFGSEGNGTLKYTMRIQQNGVLDTVWGDFERCRFIDKGETSPAPSSLPRKEGGIVSYDGSMDIYLGGDLKLGALAFEHFLFHAVGTLNVGQVDLAVDFDFQVYRGLRTEIRVPARGGDVVFSFTPGVAAILLRTGDGAYSCDFQERMCVFEVADDSDPEAAGDRVLRW